MYKKLVSILLVVSMISCVCTSAFASERSDGYDASLALAGLSHEDYLSMAAETRNFYSHTQLINTQLETKYYRIVSSPSNNDLNYIDGYGHFAMSEISNNYSMSFGLSGADFSISPSSYVSTMNNTHAQLTY